MVQTLDKPEGEAPSAEPPPAATEPHTAAFAALARRYALPASASFVELLDVNYAHFKTREDGDLYLTRFGVPFWRHLLPENWYDREWFVANRKRLIGTSTIYRVPTKTVHNTHLHLVVKWSRVGEDVPRDTLSIDRFINAEFNSPFEEFSLVMEMRAGAYGPPDLRIRTQKPLAIYVLPERLQLWQTGRSASRIAAKIAKSPGVELDILRQYVVLFGWIDGHDVVQMADVLHLRGRERDDFMARTNAQVEQQLEHKGYRVIDMKPAHIIVRTRRDGRLLCDRHSQPVYALVDYELLERTEPHEAVVRSTHRQHYLQHMARRFQVATRKPLPEHLKAAQLLGVDYIFGHAESTGGLLWVVGNDPDLFNYFLPERWRRTRKLRLSEQNDVFKTCTKDNIHLVWKISRLGERPALPADHPRHQGIVECGFNSPFEEFAHAMELTRRGFRTVYPRAIYMTGQRTAGERKPADPRRYAAMAALKTPEGEAALRRDHDYITVWGFWNGPDEVLAARDGQFYRAVDAAQARQQQLLTPADADELLTHASRRLAECGFEDLNFKADHLLISFAPDGRMVQDSFNKPEVRLCNFELVRPLPADANAPGQPGVSR
jgi:hypothetical protein